MNSELKNILESGLILKYDGEGYLKYWNWEDSLETKLREYFYREFVNKDINELKNK